MNQERERVKRGTHLSNLRSKECTNMHNTYFPYLLWASCHTLSSQTHLSTHIKHIIFLELSSSLCIISVIFLSCLNLNILVCIFFYMFWNILSHWQASRLHPYVCIAILFPPTLHNHKLENPKLMKFRCDQRCTKCAPSILQEFQSPHIGIPIIFYRCGLCCKPPE